MARQAKAAGVGRMVAPTLLLSSMIFIAVLYVNAQYPMLIPSITSGGQATVSPGNANHTHEYERLRRIDSLLIAARNKTDLREGRPFWGAAVHMVELAFRGQSDDAVIRRKGSRMYEFHTFGFNGTREPVVMEFEDNKLTCVHYPQRSKSSCNAGAQSFYAGQPFPFNYRVTVSN